LDFQCFFKSILFSSSVVLNRGVTPAQGDVDKHPGGASPCKHYNTESFLTGKCSVQFTYLKSGGLETKDNYLRAAW